MINNNQEWRQSVLLASDSIEQAIKNLNDYANKIIIVADSDFILQGTVSDGDVRRGMISGIKLSDPIHKIMNRTPLTVPFNVERELISQIMRINKIYQIPVVDESGRIIDLHLHKEFNPSLKGNHLMVIMAGGIGSRLMPHTENCPKPLIKVAGKPILEHIINRAKLEGFTRFVLAINYLGDMIESYFGDGKFLSVDIDYLREESPLGTAGALSLIKNIPNDPFVVTNGDVLTDIRYSELLDFHIEQNAFATMAVKHHQLQQPFGVVDLKGIEIIGFEEKPLISCRVNAGIYAFNPSVFDYLSLNEKFDMPDLFMKMKLKDKKIIAYPMHEPWLDIGRPVDLINARNNLSNQ